MKIIDNKNLEIGIHLAGSWYWRSEWCGHKQNFFKVENGKDFRFINTWSYFIPTTIQLFWLRFIFYIVIKPEQISGDSPMKYVPFEETHLALMDDKLDGNWSESEKEQGI